MSAATLQTLMRRARAPVIWLLVLVLVAYGHSSVMVQLLGPQHRHDLAVSSSTPNWLASAGAMFRDIRAWRAELRQRLLPGKQAHVHGDGERHSHPHAYTYQHADAKHDAAHVDGSHAHATYQRHHHDAHDATVMALEGQEGTSASDAASTAGAGSATLPLALAPRWALTVMSDPDAAWSEHATARWIDAAVSPLEHPPRA